MLHPAALRWDAERKNGGQGDIADRSQSRRFLMQVPNYLLRAVQCGRLRS